MWYTNRFNIQQLYALPTLYSCVLYLSEKKTRLLPYINWLVFITEMKSVYCVVRTGDLNKAVCACATYSINWLLFIAEMKSVYCAVRTGSLNEAVCACATYSINWLVFITEMKSVYCAVRTGSLNKAVCFVCKWLIWSFCNSCSDVCISFPKHKQASTEIELNC
jgi:hypothetical protein